MSGKRKIQKTKRFARDIKKLPDAVKKEAFEITNQLAGDLFDPQLNIRRMVGLKGVYRVVVLKNYRMIFSFDDNSIYLLRIGHRSMVYRNIELLRALDYLADKQSRSD